METLENPVVAPVNIHTIEAFMNRVGYQGVVDKVSVLFTRNLAQPWKTMFKVFNCCLTTRTSGHDQTKINILQLFHDVLNQTHVDYATLLWWDFMNNVFQKKEAIQYPCFIKLIVADLMKKFPNIPKRLEEDYHSIKDDVPLVSVYTTGNVLVRGMLILDAFLTAEIRETNDFKEYETVSPTVSASPPETKKRKQIAGESSSPRKSLKITIKQNQIVEKDDDDSEDRIDLGSHKDNPEFVVVDDDKAEENHSDDMGSLEIRNEETQTTIPTPLSSPRKILSSDKETFRINGYFNTIIEDRDAFRSEVTAFVSKEFNAHAPKIIEELFKNHIQSNVIHVHPTTTTSTETESSANLQYQLEDDFHSHHDEHQDDDAPPEGEKRVKRSKESKRSKSARGSLSKHSSEDTIKYVSKQQSQQQEWDAWEEENVIDKDEVTLIDSLSNRSRNAEEYAYHLEQSTNFIENQIVWESRQQDIPRTILKTLIFYGPQRNLNEPPRYLYNKDLFFFKHGNAEERKYVLSLHKIHVEEFLEPDLEEKLNRWVRKEFKTFNEDARLSIQHWKDSWHKRVYKQNQKKVRQNSEDCYSNHRITEVVRIITDQPHGLDFMEQILVMRANDKPDSFSEADFKYLKKNDIEDLYYLCRRNMSKKGN
ncbi:hypothetical protein Tco_0496975 [Tanacetum coccineum]